MEKIKFLTLPTDYATPAPKQNKNKQGRRKDEIINE
jgi:hypothetical protein